MKTRMERGHRIVLTRMEIVEVNLQSLHELGVYLLLAAQCQMIDHFSL